MPLVSELDRIADEAPGKVASAVEHTMEQIQNDAAALSRYDEKHDDSEDGYLHMRDAWEKEMTGKYSGVVFNTKDYSVYNEYGTRYMDAQPMARPAAYAAEDDFSDRLGEAFSV